MWRSMGKSAGHEHTHTHIHVRSYEQNLPSDSVNKARAIQQTCANEQRRLDLTRFILCCPDWPQHYKKQTQWTKKPKSNQANKQRNSQNTHSVHTASEEINRYTCVRERGLQIKQPNAGKSIALTVRDVSSVAAGEWGSKLSWQSTRAQTGYHIMSVVGERHGKRERERERDWCRGHKGACIIGIIKVSLPSSPLYCCNCTSTEQRSLKLSVFVSSLSAPIMWRPGSGSLMSVIITGISGAFIEEDWS